MAEQLSMGGILPGLRFAEPAALYKVDAAEAATSDDLAGHVARRYVDQHGPGELVVIAVPAGRGRSRHPRVDGRPPVTLPNESDANRWVPFSDAELQELEQGLGVGETHRPGVTTKLVAELVQEMRRRRRPTPADGVMLPDQSNVIQLPSRCAECGVREGKYHKPDCGSLTLTVHRSGCQWAHRRFHDHERPPVPCTDRRCYPARVIT